MPLHEISEGYAGVAISYTPTWFGSVSNPSLGNGTLAAQYTRIGRVVYGYIGITMGSTTTYGSGYWKFSYPVANLGYEMGACYCFDTSAGAEYGGGQAAGLSSTEFAFRVSNNGSTFSALTSAHPFAWANGDSLNINWTYLTP